MYSLLDDLLSKAEAYYLSDDVDIQICVNDIHECDYRLTCDISPDIDWLSIQAMLALRLAKLLQRHKST